MFAISFAFISVAVGVFGTYDVLRSAGPVGIWLWLIAAAGQTLVALVVAQFAARIALSGSSYQWASRLADPRTGWWFGWLTACFLAIVVLAIDNALASLAFIPLVCIAQEEDTARVITLVVLLVQAVVAIAATRLVGWINSGAVGLEVALVVVVAIALLVAVPATGDGSAANLTSRGVTADAPGYFVVGGGLTVAMIMGLATLVCFDSAANLAEEAKDPHRIVPRAIVGSVVVAGILGMLLLDREALDTEPGGGCLSAGRPAGGRPRHAKGGGGGGPPAAAPPPRRTPPPTPAGAGDPRPSHPR
ncbi:amino acid permease, partial [Streptomyces sp. NPDC059385]|uniref:amino acid permease n=1 Tax=Streptomyces sp. NPDC059385 TaxID=3346817 RepID=UPI0036776970